MRHRMGWAAAGGDIGKQDRRVAVRSLLTTADGDARQLSAAFESTAKGAAYTAVSIDDGEVDPEKLQETLLSALAEGKVRNPMLVWRPVLVALHAIETGVLSEGQNIAVICHSSKGLSVQKLNIRRADGRGSVLAPERREAAISVPGDIGYECLVQNARIKALGPDGLSPRTAHRALAKSVGRSALGLECRPEILRMPNGDWDVLEMADDRSLVPSAISGPLPDLSGCALVLVETVAGSSLRERITLELKSRTKRPVISLEPDAVARGALVAAGRAGDGDPVYFDFLPVLSTIVFGSDGAQSFDLINADETLEAGRVYRSPEPAQFAIPAGQPSVSVFLRKEAESRPRMATVPLEQQLSAPTPVSLWVEQKPASGRARIVLEASELGRQFAIDWDEALEDERSWEQIIADLETPPPAVPDRLVLKCGMHPWEESTRSEGLFSLLEAELEAGKVDWATFASKLAARPFGEYCISSDGILPNSIPPETVNRLDQLTEMAMRETQARIASKPTAANKDNAALQFLTWQFRRCPKTVADWLIDCAGYRSFPVGSHPFVQYQASWILIFQGLGRIASDVETENRIIQLLMSIKPETWSWRIESASMAFLLSRSDSAPLLLDPDDFERLVKQAVADFRANLHSNYTKFNYAPFLTAGLLRYRLKEPMALLLGHDPLAGDLFRAIEAAETDLLRNRSKKDPGFNRRKDKFLPILADLKTYLEGDDGNPNLLLDIYGAGP
ncbi:hypothetical protein FEE96_16850 [Parasedimentitalea maritima]|uniref:Uncharacterized protein n=1 Tax=Parasedimentitalea maritima TaxID=2578117 RepID=A0ABY2UR90_9RHOB|nr:hypothetical protein [Zongyanglinia marina]TLP59274.1 hypothetical protein FEE96_16850 [Zongyanglinia marina]